MISADTKRKAVHSVYQALATTAAIWPDREALLVLPSTANVYDIDAGAMRYAQLLDRVDTLATRFESAGYTTGMRVAVWLENRPEFFITWLALNKLGASIVPLNPDLRAGELQYLIGHAQPSLIITIAERTDSLQACADAAGIELTAQTLHSPLARPRISAVVADTLDGAAKEAALLYTSGTTGQPKGCVLSNQYFLMAGQWYANVGGIATLSHEGERMITPLPLFHMNAMAYSFMAMITVGGCLCVLDRFHPGTWWSDVRNSGATCLHYLGVMPTLLMRAAASDADRQHAVRFGFGAGVDPTLQHAFEERFNVPLVEAWAMTETGAGAVVAASTHDRLIGRSCLGKPSKELACRLVDEKGNAVANGEPGELLVRRTGENPRLGFFTEYYKNPQATAEAWQNDWFHTGDIVREDDAGNLYFVDRRKNVIRRSGENIAALEVESILMRHPAVNAAGVAAVADAIRGDEVFACLVVEQPSSKLATDIARWALDNMAYYKVPGYIAFVDRLPLTATQKVQRAELKLQAAQLLTHDDTVNTTALKRRQVSDSTT